MGELIAWFNTNAGGVTAIATVVLVLVTAYYAFTSARLTRLTKSQMDAGLRPYLSIAPFVYKGQTFFLRIKNSGRSAALNVTLKLEPDVPRQNGEALSEAALFREGTASLAPGAEYAFSLGHGYWIYGEDSEFPMEFRVTFEYEYAGVHQTEEFTVDFGSMRNSHPFASEDSAVFDGIVDALHRIERKLPNPPSPLESMMQQRLQQKD